MNIDDLNEEEISRIFEEAENFAKVQQIHLFEEDIDKELKDDIDLSIQNPDESYDLYYKKINKLLKENFYPLLKGKENKSKRELIYEQKNILLTGKIKDKNGRRGADGRMQPPNTKMQMVLDIIVDWVTNDNQSTFNLYSKFRDKNIELGYLDPKREK